MKKSVLDRVISVAILVGIMLSLTCTAFAVSANDEGVGVVPRYALIRSFYATLDVDSSSNGKATCSAGADVTNSFKISIVAELQRKSGGKWQTLESWSNSGIYSVYVSNGGEYYVTSGYSYRVNATAYVYDSAGKLVESVEKQSKEIAY